MALSACSPLEVPGQLPTDASEQAIPARVPAAYPTTWRYPAGARATFASRAMVASSARLASEAGVEILRRGGNAVDAAVAVGFALAVAYPEAGNLGGGGYMVIRMADGRTAALDYRETASAAASRDMFVGPDGKSTGESLIGAKASGVPAVVAGLAEALRRFGTLPLSDVLQPAIRLADALVVDTGLAVSISEGRYRIEGFGGKEVFFPGGRSPAAGSSFSQPTLARTLRILAARGPDAFYSGSIADSIVAEMRRSGGLITREDLARYRPLWREPVRSTYRGHTLLAMPPSSSGGTTMSEALNILEALGPATPYGTPGRMHALASAFQRAFIDRNSKLGDPAFADLPIGTLTSKEYAARLARTIAADRATPTSRLATQMREGTETTHYSVVDPQGNAVATTTTINDLFGSGVYVSGAGFFLNNTMDDFASMPGRANLFGLVQGEVNAIAPGKRALSAMSPTIVLDPKGELLLIVGGRGGPRIITTTAQVILNVIDHRMSLADAVSAPRMHHQALPDSIRVETGGFDPATIRALQAMGHTVYDQSPTSGKVVSIMRVKGGYEGMDDIRGTGAAVGF
ncbi:MAG TPA: gamma-glutamyltransferase [Gemmatimonadaceae bacterium]|nr:gamma-glutamyltransferase [Gemmatimonadaceae bacterium]